MVIPNYDQSMPRILEKTKTRTNYESTYGFSAMQISPKTPDTLYENNERAQIVMEAIQQLPEEQRTVLILKEYEGLKFREIADTLEISEIQQSQGYIMD